MKSNPEFEKIVKKLCSVSESIVRQYPNHSFSVNVQNRELHVVVDGKATQFTLLGYPHKTTRRQFIRIEFDNGKVIEKSSATSTLIEFINYVGAENARKADIMHGDIELISDTKDPRYASRQKALDDGYYIFTKTDIQVKVDDINRIARFLGIDLKADVIIEISRP